MWLVLAGIILSLMGSLPPGLISLSVAQTSIARSWQAGMALALGAAFAEFFQAWVAIVLTDWFLTHNAVIQWFNWFSIPVFLPLKKAWALRLVRWSQSANLDRPGGGIGPQKQCDR